MPVLTAATSGNSIQIRIRTKELNGIIWFNTDNIDEL